MKLAELFIDFKSSGHGAVMAQMSGMKNTLGGVQQSLSHVGEATNGLVHMFGNLVQAMAAVPLVHMLKEYAEYGDRMKEMEERTGISTDKLQALSYAARQQNSSIGDVTVAFKFLQMQIQAASQGSAEARENFHKLGISFEELGDKEGMEQFLSVIDAMGKKLPQDAAKVAMARKMFGRGGVSMMPLIRGGREGIEGLMGRAEKLGLVLPEEEIRKAREFSDGLKEMADVGKSAALMVGAQLAPALKEFIEKIVHATIGVRNFVASHQGLVVFAAKMTAVVAGLGVAKMAMLALTFAVGGLVKALWMIAKHPVILGLLILAAVLIKVFNLTERVKGLFDEFGEKFSGGAGGWPGAGGEGGGGSRAEELQRQAGEIANKMHMKYLMGETATDEYRGLARQLREVNAEIEKESFAPERAAAEEATKKVKELRRQAQVAELGNMNALREAELAGQRETTAKKMALIDLEAKAAFAKIDDAQNYEIEHTHATEAEKFEIVRRFNAERDKAWADTLKKRNALELARTLEIEGRKEALAESMVDYGYADRKASEDQFQKQLVELELKRRAELRKAKDEDEASLIRRTYGLRERAARAEHEETTRAKGGEFMGIADVWQRVQSAVLGENYNKRIADATEQTRDHVKTLVDKVERDAALTY